MAVRLTSGSRLRAYTLTTDMTASDAGTSMWAFAEQDGFEYFIKCYLTPVFPDPDSPGSERSKARKRERCAAFEARMNRIERVVRECGQGAFLVHSVDFFREDGSYYKITKKIHTARSRVSTLPAQKQLLILLSAAYSIRALHDRSRFIHADIKPENFMIQRTGAGIIANLIDFDAGFFTGQPPAAEDQVGDQRYWAPERIAWMAHEKQTQPERSAGELQQALDVFSLGLTFCEYLAGTFPDYPSVYAYTGEAVLNDIRLTLPEPAQPCLQPLMPLIQEMLHRNPLRRPRAAAVHEQLRAFNRKHFVSERTYRKLAAAWKNTLAAGGQSLRERWAARTAKPGYQSASELQVRGLKTGASVNVPPIVKRFRFGAKP
jgi:eukaryotic-like serine/threonine-protein kinase